MKYYGEKRLAELVNWIVDVEPTTFLIVPEKF